jgi:hypothetical protein
MCLWVRFGTSDCVVMFMYVIWEFCITLYAVLDSERECIPQLDKWLQIFFCHDAIKLEMELLPM